MFLWIIFAEIFLGNIRKNNGIKGIVIGENELKTSTFAADTTIYIGSNSSLAHLEMQLMYFEKATDKKFNKTKCIGIWLGSNKSDPRKLLWIKWNSDTIKVSGYTCGHNTIQTWEQNREKVEKNPRGYTEMGTVTAIPHKKEINNKPGNAK